MAFGSESDFEKDIASNIYFLSFFIFLLLAGCATGGRHDSICFFHWRKNAEKGTRGVEGNSKKNWAYSFVVLL